MKLCPKCGTSPLPFMMVFVIASLSAFATWLTLTYSQAELIVRLGGSIIAFIAVGATLLHYVLTCMKRHCRHQKSPAKTHHPSH